MKVTNKIKIHLDDLRMMPPIDVMQGDAYTRELEFSLYSGSEAWEVPEGVSVAVAYHGASGQGIYDTLPDGIKGYTVSGNVVTVLLIPQVAAVAGRTMVTVLFTDEKGKQLATFGVIVQVAPNPAIGAGKPQDYYNIREWIGAGPLWVELYANEDGTYTADKTMSDIQNANAAGRAVYCVLETAEQAFVTLPMVKMSGDVCYFSAVCERVEWLVTITGDEDATVTVSQKDLPYELRVVVLKYEDGTCTADKGLADIYRAYTDKIPVVCHLVIPDSAAPIRLTLGSLGAGVAIFNCLHQGHVYTVTITANGVTVEVDVNAVSGVVLKDQVTGETYTLCMDDADLHIVAGGKAAAARDNILLVDIASGENYEIYVSDGKLMLESED